MNVQVILSIKSNRYTDIYRDKEIVWEKGEGGGKQVETEWGKSMKIKSSGIKKPQPWNGDLQSDDPSKPG